MRSSIDPYLFQEDGRVYLFWGSWGGIWGIELTADGRAVRPGAEPFQIGGNAYEAARIEKVDDTYWFFGSMGSCCEGANSEYSVVAARLDSLRGDGAVVAPGHVALTQDDAGSPVVNDGHPSYGGK